MKIMYDIVKKIFEENGLNPEEIQGFAVPNESSVTVTVPNLSEKLKDGIDLKDKLIRGIATQAGIEAKDVIILN